MKKILSVLFLFLTTLLKAQDIDVLYYHFGITLSEDKDAIIGMAAINFVHKTNEKIIRFDLTAQNKEGKGMKIIAATTEGSVLKTSQDEQHLFVTLPYAKKGDTQTIAVSYFGIPDDGLIISKNKLGDRTFFADNWPNRAHHWLPCIDSLTDKALFSFDVIAPPVYNVVSNGVKTGEYILPNGLKSTYWEEDVPLPTKVMVIGVAKFATKIFEDSPADIPVSALVYPQDSTKGFSDFAVAPDIVIFFSGYIAPFPYNKLANVQSTTIFGGMENASCIFYDEKSITGDGSFEDVVAHEIAHQWFGDAASEKSFAHLWLSEGFATYMTNLYWEHKYGKEAMLERLKKDREEIIAFAGRSNHAVVDSTDNLMSLLNANSYQKGGWILHMLRNEVGDSLFQKIIQAYYNQYKGSNAETRDFETVAEKVSGKDLKPFFDQWLYQGGVPELNISWEYKNSAVMLLPYGEPTYSKSQKKYGYKLTTDVLFLYKDGRSEKHQLQFEPHGPISFDFPTKEKPARIILDPDTKLLFEGEITEKTTR